MQHILIKILTHNYIELSGFFFVVYLCKIRVYFVENIVYGTSQNLKWLVERLGNTAEEKWLAEKDIKRHTTSNLSRKLELLPQRPKVPLITGTTTFGIRLMKPI